MLPLASLGLNGLCSPFNRSPYQNPACPVQHRAQQGNIKLRRRYGPHHRRLLKCTTCGTEFSELKGTPYWNARCSQDTVDAVVNHVTHGNSFVTTAELVGCHRTTVARIVRTAGTHAQHLHDLNARDLQVTSIQADERYGFVGRKKEPAWDATVIDPSSKFLIQGEVGERTATLTRSLLVQAKERLADPHGLVLFTDGFLSYQTLFPEVFGRPYRPARQGTRGRFPKTAYRVPRSSAHVRIIKEYSGKRVVSVRTEIAAGTRTRVHEELQRLGYRKPNTSAVERQNATARRMNPHLARKSLAFARLTVHRVIRIPFVSLTDRNTTNLPTPRPEPVSLLLASLGLNGLQRPFNRSPYESGSSGPGDLQLVPNATWSAEEA
ncbi:IS1 transposase [Deinococcus sp. 14RED07]|uniref:IS1 transposase n=1 Tax=Deinococcus sp. 14RED07 TaxID=2745874 RepID=UPI001E2B5416|nr:IS1 transposase [Deinococcus sp. 14RED07]